MARRIGRYEVIAEIGRGGFGHVYRALDPTVGRPVAIKVLTASDEDGMLTRFRGEATVSGRLRHPNIVTVYDFGDQDGMPYIVMELLEGRDLQHVIESRRLPSILERVQIMSQIAGGLRHAHAAGVVHRDVKPANIMILSDSTVKVMDFGIAIITQATHSRLTPRGAMIGTFRYMAPEQFRGAEPDARSDIFAYGLIFYELLTGVHPFYSPEAAAQMYNILNVDPIPVEEIFPDCPKELHAVVARLLQKDPELRYQTLDDVLFDVEPALIDLRRAKARSLIEEARSAQAQGQLDSAQLLVRQALELAPGFEGAREFREQIQGELRRQTIRPKVDDLLRKGQEALITGNPTEAVARFESAIRLDPTDTKIKTLLQQAKAQVENLREANRLTSEAVSALRAGDYSGALRLAKQALNLVPNQTAALRVQGESEAALESERRKARLGDSLIRIRRLIKSHSWDEAAALLADLSRNFPGEPSISQLLLELREGKEKEDSERALAAGLSAARKDIQNGDLQGALTRLEQLSDRHPDSAEVEHMIGFVRAELEAQNQRAFVENSLNTALSKAASHDFDAAIKIIEVGLQRYPADPALQREWRRLAAEQREAARRAAVTNAISHAKQLRERGNLTDAFEILEKFLREQGDDPDIINLKEVIVREQETARRKAELHEFVHRANQLLERGKLEQAAGLLKDSPAQLRDAPELTQLLSKVENRQRAVRDQALDDALVQTKHFAQEGLFEKAFGSLDALHGQYGDDPRISSARKQVQDAVQNAERQTAELISHANAMLTVDPAGALSLVEASPEHLRDLPEIRELRQAAINAAEQKRVADAINLLVQRSRDQCGRKAFSEALMGLAKALQEYPGQPELLNAQQQAVSAQTKHLRELLASGQTAFETGKFGEGFRILDEIRKVEPNAGGFREEVLSIYAKGAQSALERDWHEAEPFLSAISSLDPDHPSLGQLKQGIAAVRKKESIHDCLLKASEFRNTGNLPAALGTVEKGLSSFPQENDLVRARDQISAELRAFEESLQSELTAIESRVTACSDPAELKALAAQAAAIGQRLPANSALFASAGLIEARAAKRAKQIKRAQLLKLLPNWRRTAAAIAVLAVAGFGIYLFTRRPPPPFEARVTISSNQTGAAVRVADKTCVTPDCHLSVFSGTYTLTGSKSGFKPLSRSIVIAKGQPVPDVALQFEPFPELLQVSTNFDKGQVSVDGNTADLKDGQFSLGDISEGSHTMRITANGALFEMSWQSVPGQVPRLLKPLTAKDVQAAVVVSSGSEGAIACNCELQHISVDGVAAAASASPGIATPLNRLKEGERSIEIGGRRLVVNVIPNPALNISLALDRDVGTLLVDAGEDNARIYLNNKPYNQRTGHGTLRIPLASGTYSVRVEKDGFRSPTSQMAEVKRAQDVPLKFSLTPLPATLELTNATPEALVKFDGQPIGKVNGSGRFSYQGSPGQHLLALNRDGFNPAQIPVNLAAGTVTRLGADQLKLSPTKSSPGPVTPPTTTPTQGPSEADEWVRISSSPNRSDIEGFIRKYPNSSHLAELQSRLTQIKREEDARQAEQAWQGTDKTNADALRNYLTSYPNGPHAGDARSGLAALAQPPQPPPSKPVDDSKAVLSALQNFQTAYNQHDVSTLSQLWRDSRSLAATVNEFKVAKVSQLQLSCSPSPSMSGSTATVSCTRTKVFQFKGGGKEERNSDNVEVTLDKENSAWVIRSIRALP
jgi:serine/threonine-protein kinase